MVAGPGYGLPSSLSFSFTNIYTHAYPPDHAYFPHIWWSDNAGHSAALPFCYLPSDRCVQKHHRSALSAIVYQNSAVSSAGCFSRDMTSPRSRTILNHVHCHMIHVGHLVTHTHTHTHTHLVLVLVGSIVFIDWNNCWLCLSLWRLINTIYSFKDKSSGHYCAYFIVIRGWLLFT